MSSEEKSDRAKELFESRFMSILLMITLVTMCVLFVVIIWQIFGRENGLNVIMYTGIGLGSGIILTIIILIITKYTILKTGKNLFLGLVFITLIVSLIVSLILYYNIGSWAFINASSLGLGLTTGIALTYLLLAMFNSKLLKKAEKIDKIQELNN
jgi:hypothetical protein